MRALATVLLATSFAVVAFGQKVKVETTEVVFDAPPQMVRNVTMVPIRNMVTAMDATMKWDIEKKVVSVWKGNRKFDILLDSRRASVNDKIVNMDEATYMHRGRIYVPLKFFAEACGYLTSSENGFIVLRPQRPVR